MFVRINTTRELIRDHKVEGIVPLLSLSNAYSLHFDSPENGTLGQVITHPILSIIVQLNEKEEETTSSMIIFEDSLLLDNIVTPLVDSVPFKQLPDEAPIDNTFIASKTQFTKALGKYSTYLHQLDEERAANIPIVDTRHIDVQGEGAPEPTTSFRRPTDNELHIQKNADILLSKMVKALNRDITLVKSNVIRKDKGPVFANQKVPVAIEQLVAFGLSKEEASKVINNFADTSVSKAYSFV